MLAAGSLGMCLAVLGIDKLIVLMEADEGFRYCSKECQIKLWPAHKKDCKRVQKGSQERYLALGFCTAKISSVYIQTRSEDLGMIILH